MSPNAQKPLQTLVLGSLMPATLLVGILIWCAAAYFAHVDHTDRLKDTLKQRLEMRAAVSATRIQAVVNAVSNAAGNSITIAAMAGTDVDRVVQPYLKSITFAEATAQYVALVDYRGRLIVADSAAEWTPPDNWDQIIDNVLDGTFQSIVEKDRLVLAAPVVLGTFVEGALVTDISLQSLFAEMTGDAQAAVVAATLSTAQFDLWHTGVNWQGQVIWPVDGMDGLAIQISKSIEGAGFWENPTQAALLAMVGLLIVLSTSAVVIAARSVSRPVRNLVEELAHKGLEISLPNAQAPAEIWSLTQRFRAAAQDVEQALIRERELTAQQSQFVTVVSHEFRTPLAIIDGTASALERRRDRMSPDRVDEKLATIRTAVTRLLRLMESTLSAARLESNGFQLERAEMDLPALVQELAGERLSLAPDLTIDLDLDRLPAIFVADRRLLTSVIDNLLSNATKYGGTPPKISVSGGVQDKMVYLSVTDNGVGIPPEQIPRLGERFFRASTSGGISGTGVGLHMVKMVLDAHGGRLDVKSALGNGSTFTIWMPLNIDTIRVQTSRSSRPIADTWRLVYTSGATEEPDDYMIEAIRRKSAENNEKTGITGALTYCDGAFAQVLEGPKARVIALFDRLSNDPRHMNVETISFEPVAARAYAQWDMVRIPTARGTTALDALQADLALRSAA